MDISSSAISASATTGGASNRHPYYTVTIPVTAVSGTNPTYDFVVEEYSQRLGSWLPVFAFPRITATGTYVSPVLKRRGTQIRYVQTIGGTDTPTFTRSVSHGGTAETPDFFTQIIDRTLTVNTGSSATSAIWTEGSKNAQLIITMGAVTTTAPQLTIQGTVDGSNWFALGSALTSVASSTVQLTVNNINAQRIRAIVSTAGSGATLGHIVLKSW